MVDARQQLGQHARCNHLQASNHKKEADEQQRPMSDWLAKHEFDEREMTKNRCASGTQHDAYAAEEMAGARTEPNEKINKDEVEQHAIRSRDPMIGAPVSTRVVGDNFLRNTARGGYRGEPGRNEAMHLPVETHIPDSIRPKGLQGATVIS